MPIAYWCILVAALLPYLAVGPAKTDPAMDNASPRERHREQTGLQGRAYGAHQNSFEVFPLFAAAVLVAGQFGAEGHLFDGLAMGWVALRVAYIGAYWLGFGLLRSLLWFCATVVSVTIFTLPAWS